MDTNSITHVRLQWICDQCRSNIDDGDGYLCVDYLKAKDRRLQWRAFHSACDPNPDRVDYWFAVERIRTVAELLDWNEHLHEKSWINLTNWDRYIQAAVNR